MASSCHLQSGPLACTSTLICTSRASCVGGVCGSHRLAVFNVVPSGIYSSLALRWPFVHSTQAPLLVPSQLGSAAASALLIGLLLDSQCKLVVESVALKTNGVLASRLPMQEALLPTPSKLAKLGALRRKNAPSRLLSKSLSGPAAAVSVSLSEPDLKEAKVESKLKLCTVCHHHKLLRNFQAKLSSSDGLESICRACLASLRAVRSGRELHHLGLSIEEAWEQARVCKACEERQELREFARNKWRSDGLQIHCRSCVAEYGMARPRQEISVKNQVCSMCEVEKPAGEFFRHAQTKAGLHPYCKACCAERRRLRGKQLKSSGVFLGVEKKFCPICKEEKRAAEFYKNTQSHDGLNASCKACLNAVLKARPKSQT